MDDPVLKAVQPLGKTVMAGSFCLTAQFFHHPFLLSSQAQILLLMPFLCISSHSLTTQYLFTLNYVEDRTFVQDGGEVNRTMHTGS